MLTNIEVAFYAGDNENGSVSFEFNGEKQELDWSINKYGEVVTDREDTHALGLDDGDVVEIEAEIETAVLIAQEC
jgi:formylmethanofuran dehydrogenase subunit D